MKKIANKLFAVILVLFVAIDANAQIKDIGKMISGGTEDANKLLEAYLKPYANAFGADLNGGWYNTAKNHKKLGFDLTFSISMAFVPKADKTFNAGTLGLSSDAHVTGTTSPTVAGKKENGQTIAYPLLGADSLKYSLPQGTNWGVIPAPIFQLGIGTVKETDLIIRYVPKINIGNFGSAQLWGVAVKHSIKQYIPGIKMAPFFNLSAFIGYTQMKTVANLSFQPTVYNEMLEPDPQPYSGTNAFDNQKLEIKFSGFTANILASFDLPVVTFYGGLGISSTSAKLALKGDFPMPEVQGTDIVITDGVTDPLNVKIKATDGSPTKPRINVGMKFKMAVITFHFDYTRANYNVATAGLGISIR